MSKLIEDAARSNRNRAVAGWSEVNKLIEDAARSNRNQSARRLQLPR